MLYEEKTLTDSYWRTDWLPMSRNCVWRELKKNYFAKKNLVSYLNPQKCVFSVFINKISHLISEKYAVPASAVHPFLPSCISNSWGCYLQVKFNVDTYFLISKISLFDLSRRSWAFSCKSIIVIKDVLIQTGVHSYWGLFNTYYLHKENVVIM